MLDAWNALRSGCPGNLRRWRWLLPLRVHIVAENSGLECGKISGPTRIARHSARKSPRTGKPERTQDATPSPFPFQHPERHRRAGAATEGTRQHEIRETLTSSEHKLNPRDFVRIHRSTIVNVHRIKEIRPWFHGYHVVLLENGRELRMNRYQKEVAKRLGLG
jgi:hypothetical protein